jgi:hypothetical protein
MVRAVSATSSRCPGCGERVEPTQAPVVYAVQLRRLDTKRPATWVETLGGYFHDAGCLRSALGTWREKPKP